MTNNIKVTSAGGCVGVIILFAASTGLLSFVLQIAWNLLIPSVFGGPTITFWQSLTMIVLISIISSVLFRNSGSDGK